MGTASIMASKVTESVPATRARMPYCSRTTDVGRQFWLVANSFKFSWERAGAPSIKTKMKMATTKMIALQPQRRMMNSMTGSARSRPRARPRLREGKKEKPEAMRLIFILRPGTLEACSRVREHGTQTLPAKRARLSGSHGLVLGQGDEADVLDDLLAFGAVAPVDEIFHRAGGLAGGVDEQRTRDRIAAVDGCLNAGGN